MREIDLLFLPQLRHCSFPALPYIINVFLCWHLVSFTPLIAAYYSIILIYYYLANHFPVEGHLGCFKFGATANMLERIAFHPWA